MIRTIIRKMMLTQILSTVTGMICLLIDSIVIGRFLGVDGISAYGYASPMVLIFTAISTMIGAGSQVLCARTMGVGDRKGTNRCFTAAVTASLVISVIGIAVVFIFADPLCTLLGVGADTAEAPVFTLTRDYLRGFVLGAPALMLQQIMVPFMQIAGKRKRLLGAIGAMSIGDVLFDLLNVFVFRFGMLGMGLASALSHYIAIAFVVSFFLDKNCIFRFRASLLDKAVFLSMFREGTPVLVNQVCLVLLPLVRNNLLTYYGGFVAVAAYSVTSAVGSALFSIGSAVSFVSLTLSSMFFADKDKRSLKETVKTLLAYGITIYLVFDIIILIAAEPVAMIFIKDVSVVGIAALGMRLVVPSYIPCVINGVLKNYYQGIGHTGLTMVICMMQNFIMTTISALILGSFLGATGVWLSITCGEVLTLLFVFVYVSVKNKKPVHRSDDILMMSEIRGTDENDLFVRVVTKQEDVVEVSKSASDFCRRRGLERKTGMYIALAIEEMVNNTIRYGFADGKAHSIDVRIIVNDEDTLFRIRDDCQSFDPVRYYELYKYDDPYSHIGIKMVMRLVKEAKYDNTLNLNNLFLTI
ncbi:MAG: ATP-binding protein [Lachnospiraceae bacterium]|nr:ATP-binding protein [Lachnospiraceae bacterium]